MTRLLDAIDSPADLKRLAVSDLPRLCQELRDEIVQTCAKNGGHLGSSLGAVELNVALHYVFETPKDKLVWDVGHQAYAHKLLTGRREQFRTIRLPGGLAGFPERHESPHDAFGVGHASTAISAALGMLEAKRMRGEAGKVVAIIGDGAMTGGIAFEGLNQAGYLGRDLLVVLNDNEMSISPNVGAMSEWLSKKFASRTYNRWRHQVKDFLAKIPKGEQAIEVIRHGINATKALLTPGILFEGLGFHYVGPVDGHDVAGLVEVFQKLATFDAPVVLHAVTTKGKGYAPAEGDAATRGHGLSFFDVATGKPVKKSGAKAYTELFADALCEEMARDERVVAIPLPDSVREELAALVQSGTQRFGVLSVQSVEPHAFDGDDERLLNTLGVEAAIATAEKDRRGHVLAGVSCESCRRHHQARRIAGVGGHGG